MSHKATIPLIFPLQPNSVGSNKGTGFSLKPHYNSHFVLPALAFSRIISVSYDIFHPDHSGEVHVLASPEP